MWPIFSGSLGLLTKYEDYCGIFAVRMLLNCLFAPIFKKDLKLAPGLASMIMTKIEQKETLFQFVPCPSESRLKVRSSLPFYDTENDTCLSLNIRCTFLQLSVRLNSVVKGFGSLRLLKTV